MARILGRGGMGSSRRGFGCRGLRRCICVESQLLLLVQGSAGDSLSIRAETGGEDFCLEVDVMQHCALSEVHE